MKTLTLLCSALVLFGFSNANADLVFYNATPAKYTIAATLPNGKVDTRDIDLNSPGLDSKSFVLAAGVKSVKVAITDETGETVWKGVGKQGDAFVIVPDKKGVKAIYAGVYGGYETQTALFMNLTGEPLTIDLVGRNGRGAVRGIVPPTAFDAKKLVRLDPKESTYDLEGKTKGGEKVEIQGTLNPGRYCLIWKDDRGNVKATALGNVPKK